MSGPVASVLETVHWLGYVWQLHPVERIQCAHLLKVTEAVDSLCRWPFSSSSEAAWPWPWFMISMSSYCLGFRALRQTATW